MTFEKLFKSHNPCSRGNFFFHGFSRGITPLIFCNQNFHTPTLAIAPNLINLRKWVIKISDMKNAITRNHVCRRKTSRCWKGHRKKNIIVHNYKDVRKIGMWSSSVTVLDSPIFSHNAWISSRECMIVGFALLRNSNNYPR